MRKNYNIFINMHFDFCYCSAKFETKIQFVYEETKKTDCIVG